MTTEQTTTEFTTARGRTVRLGDHFRDARENNRRDLIVESLGVYQPPPRAGIEQPAVCSVTCTVSRPLLGGAGIEIMRPTTMDANRLTGRDFVLITEGGAQ